MTAVAMPSDPLGFHFNVFRYIGDLLHMFGVIVLVLVLLKNRSCVGVSRSTQILYFLVFITRYVDLVKTQLMYLVVFKVFYILASVLVLVIFHKWEQTYERTKDTCSLAVIIFPCVVASYILTKASTVAAVLLVFSRFLEGFAMVPQYVFCYRDRTSTDKWIVLYVTAKGLYRVFYACNWIFKAFHDHHYSDVNAWIGGAIEIFFFCDYLLSRFTDASLLRAMTLGVDDQINQIKDKVEHTVRGKKTPEASGVSERGCELRQRRPEKTDVDDAPAESEV